MTQLKRIKSGKSWSHIKIDWLFFSSVI
jgi:hypothetical protein